jgi:pyruvate dehydrogenase (quinone)
MMATPETVADFLVQRLRAWGVERIFGYAGDGINPIMGALHRAGNRPELIQPAHEELAALMACGHAKLTGEVGVCLATQGPGAIHVLNGLYDAALDHQPVVAIVGQQARESLGGRAQQEVDLPVLFKDVAKAFVQEVVSPDQVKHVIDRAFRVALAERAVTCVILPHDVQQGRRWSSRRTSTGRSTPGWGTRRRGCCPGRPICAGRRTCSTPGSGWPCSPARARSAPRTS